MGQRAICIPKLPTRWKSRKKTLWPDLSPEMSHDESRPTSSNTAMQNTSWRVAGVKNMIANFV
jgi:hypothetical protein